MEPETELDQLVAEQKADDTPTVSPQFRNQIPMGEIDDLLGMEFDGELVSFEHLNRPHGAVLTGSAPWHGTRGGYENHKCRCLRCKEANAERSRRRRNGMGK